MKKLHDIKLLGVLLMVATGLHVSAQEAARVQPVKKTNTTPVSNTNPKVAPWEKQAIQPANSSTAKTQNIKTVTAKPAEAQPIQAK